MQNIPVEVLDFAKQLTQPVITPAALLALANGDESNFIAASTPGGIEMQESQGQRDFVKSSKLPIQGSLNNRNQFEQMGIVFGEPVDDLFVAVTLPAGWKLEATEHAMHNSLLDDKGRTRASIFYKAAFYDRSAHINLCRRFRASTQPIGGWANSETESRFEGVVTDGDTVIFTTEPTMPKPGRNDDWSDFYAEKDARYEAAEAWLGEKYPDYKNPLAYWD